MPNNSPIDLEPELSYNELCKEPRQSQDSTLKISLNEENMLKRLRQLKTGSVQVIALDGQPIILVIGGRVEFLRKQ